jgi:hypothetical protein
MKFTELLHLGADDSEGTALERLEGGQALGRAQLLRERAHGVYGVFVRVFDAQAGSLRPWSVIHVRLTTDPRRDSPT